MSLRYALLGMLAVTPGTGYELAQRFDSSMSNAWYASHSQIYPELAKLCEEGMLEVVGEGPRRSRTFGITQAGRDDLRDWLVETEPNRNQRNETTIRWFLLKLLPADDRRAVLQREIADVTAYHADLQASEAALEDMDPPHPFLPMVNLAVRTAAVMLDWLKEQLAAIE